MNNDAQFFASCPRGLEAVLATELAALQAQSIKAVDGGVHFSGPLTLGYAVNLHSRVASRVLWRVGQARYRATGSDQDIYVHACARLAGNVYRRAHPARERVRH